MALPGTPFVRAFLNQVEREDTYTKEEGCADIDAAITRFIAEFYWTSDSQLGQLERCAYTASIVLAREAKCEEKASKTIASTLTMT